MDSCCRLAKLSGDYIKQKTKNHVYKAEWASKTSYLIFQTKKKFDKNQTAVEIKQDLINSCSTPLPRSRGIQMKDVYLNTNFQPAPKSRSNDCYVYINYKLNLTDEDFQNAAFSEAEYAEHLEDFLDSFYYQNNHLFQLKLAMMKLSLQKQS